MPTPTPQRARLRAVTALASTALLLTLTALVSATPLVAQRFELTPYVGWASSLSLDPDDFVGGRFGSTLRFDEGSSFGLIGSYALTERWFVEASIAEQDSDLRAFSRFGAGTSARRYELEVYEVGAQYRWSGELFRPFVGLNLGQTHVADDLGSAGSDDFLSLAAVAGVRAYHSDRFGLRLDARYSTLFFDGDREGPICQLVTCETDLRDTTSDRLELRLGLVLGFGERGSRPRAATASGVEVTPFVSLRASDDLGSGFFAFEPTEFEVDDGLRFGLLVGVPLRDDRWALELLLEHEESDGSFNLGGEFDLESFRYGIGLRRAWPGETTTPFAFANLGATTLEAETFRDDRSSQPTLGLGAGVAVDLGRRLALRVDGEYAMLRIAETDNDFPPCRLTRCLRDRDTEMWGQIQLRVGVTYRFGGR